MGNATPTRCAARFFPFCAHARERFALAETLAHLRYLERRGNVYELRESLRGGASEDPLRA